MLSGLAVEAVLVDLLLGELPVVGLQGLGATGLAILLLAHDNSAIFLKFSVHFCHGCMKLNFCHDLAQLL